MRVRVNKVLLYVKSCAHACVFNVKRSAYDYMYPVHNVINVNLLSVFCVAYWMVQKFGLPQIQALSGTMSAGLATIGVSCALSSHVLSAGR